VKTDGPGPPAAPCRASRVVHSIGHSTRLAEALLTLLREHEIQCVVDVRRWPTSRRFPHFRREPLEASLGAEGIGYVWHQDLGGYRTSREDSLNTAWRVAAFRGYADFMLTPAFEAAMETVERLAAGQRIGFMCAEALPDHCHRRLLADGFTVRQWSVRHILDGGCEEHRLLPFARPSGTRILYPAPMR
jgi:uncharacterized protein (DUF488 family)